VPGRPHAEIYATPAFAHVAVRRRRRADRLSRSAPARPRPTDTGSRPD
jgi:hypothetical protein